MTKSHTPSSKSGRLIMAAASIGNLEDAPRRSLEALRTADLLVFEEDKAARQFLKAAGIHRPYAKYSEHQEQSTLRAVREHLEQGKTVVYMSDQGTANLADPGKDLLELAYDLKGNVQVIPGPSSITAAISACPFNMGQFMFAGLLPREESQRIKTLKHLLALNVPVIILDTPYRLEALLNSCAKVIPKNQPCFLSIDISGPHEQHICKTVTKLGEYVSNHLQEKLNFVLIIKGNKT